MKGAAFFLYACFCPTVHRAVASAFVVVALVVSGCFAPRAAEDRLPWDDGLPSGDWRVAYRAEQGGRSQQLVLAVEDGPGLPGVPGAVRVGLSGEVDDPAAYFLVDGSMVARDHQVGGEAKAWSFFTPERERPEMAEMLLLPLLLRSPHAEHFLPSVLPVASWQEQLAGARIGEPVTFEVVLESVPVWRVEYVLDASPFPVHVKEELPCRDCPEGPRPLFHDRAGRDWSRTSVTKGGPPRSDSGPGLPASLERLPGLEHSAFPEIDPGGQAVALSDAIAYARRDDAVAALLDHDGARVTAAAWSGSRAMGDTEWRVTFHDGEGQGLQATIDAPRGDLDILLGTASVKVEPVEPLQDPAGLVEQVWIPALDAVDVFIPPCGEEPLGMVLTNLGFSRAHDGHVLRDPWFMMVRQGMPPSCSGQNHMFHTSVASGRMLRIAGP